MKKCPFWRRKLPPCLKTMEVKKPEVADNHPVQISLADLGPVAQDPRPDLPGVRSVGMAIGRSDSQPA